MTSQKNFRWISLLILVSILLTGAWYKRLLVVGASSAKSDKESAVASRVAPSHPASPMDTNDLLVLRFDNSLNGENGETPTQATGTSFLPGFSNQGVLLPSSNQFFYASANNINAAEGTFACWINSIWDGNDGQAHSFLQYGGAGGILIGKDSAGNLRLILNRAGVHPGGEISGSTNIGEWRSNQWHHLAFTWSNTSKQLALYLDGALKDQHSFTTNLPTINTATFQLGGDGSGSSANAVFDNVRVSDVPRTQQQISAWMLEGQLNYYGKTVEQFRLYGQKYITETAPNKVTPNSSYHASGVIVDRNSTPNIVYTVSSGNSRILGYRLNCPPNTTCPLDETRLPDIIIGQPNAESATCNGDNNFGYTKNPTASSLCMQGYPFSNNTAEAFTKVNIDVDAQGNLYVPDFYNNRILKYNQPLNADTSGGKGDAIADFVWGQSDLNSNGRNRGPNYGNVSPPDDHSLWIGVSVDNQARGVAVDQSGNVWAADTFNGRVLRFPANSKNANLVIGQPDFTSSGCVPNGPLNRLCEPILARVHPVTGDLFVLDSYTPTFSRILVFHPPFTNGMAAYKVIKPLQNGPFTNWESFDGQGTYQFQSTGFIFNTFKQGEYAQGEIWINEFQSFRSLLIDFDGNIIKVIGAPNQNTQGGPSAYGGQYSICGPIDGGGYKMAWPGGSIGMDNANNIYFADQGFHRFYRFALPYNLSMVEGVPCLPDGNGALGPRGPNVQSDDHFGGAVGLARYGNQLIIHELGGRLKAYNNFTRKDFGASPDAVVQSMSGERTLIAGSIDDQGRLWMTRGAELQIFQLPLVSNTQQPIAPSVKLYWADNGQQIVDEFNGIAFDPASHKLYIANRQGTRILRVSNYNEFNNQLLVDMVLGQQSKTGLACNQGLPSPNAQTLCNVSQIQFDRFGNLFVVENSYECAGNDRITMYSAASLQGASGLFPNLAATKVYVAPNFTETGPCAYGTVDQPGSPVSLAFNSRNEMVVGNDGYYGDAPLRQHKQLWLYRNPLIKATPDASIGLIMGAPGEMAFDANDNLIVQDHTWNRVSLINFDRDPEWLDYLPDALVITGRSPASLSVGMNSFTLTVTGNNFVSGSAILWNGSPRTTTFISSNQLQALIPATDIATVGTAAISVTKPNGEKSNSLPFTVSGGNCSAITVNPAILGDAEMGVAYTQSLTATGGTSPYTFTLINGTLPTGLMLSADGNLTGLPSSRGSYSFTASVTDANGCFGDRVYTLTVTAVITVNSTADTLASDGACTLREAILNANNNNQSGSTDCAAGAMTVDRIIFNIPGAGPHTISPMSQLPAITAPVIIDGSTQPGASCSTVGGLKIELSGASAGSSSGLLLNTSLSTVRGLVINRFQGSGIFLVNGGNNTIACNYIGTSVSGFTDLGNAGSGISIGDSFGNNIGDATSSGRNVISGNNEVGVLMDGVTTNNNLVRGNYIGLNAAGVGAVGNSQSGILIRSNATNNTIGGQSLASRNVISGNLGVGIFLGASNNLVQGNLVGTNAVGTGAVGNGFAGIEISVFSGNLIGGASASARNIISGNNVIGVLFNNVANNNQVLGNYIGTDVNGTAALGNGTGVVFGEGANNNFIGSGAAGAGNLIFGNTNAGVEFVGLPSVNGNAILGNAIFSNGGLGIDLGNNGVTPNDSGDSDSGPNNLQNFPVLVAASSNSVNTTVTGSLNSTANANFTIQFFSNTACDSSGNGEGQVFLGQTSVTTDANGNAAINAVLPVPIAVGSFLTATTTDAAKNTSEFSTCIAVVSGGCSYSINPTSQSIAAAGGNGSTSVTAGSGCSWTAVSNDPWITITSGASGNGNGTVNYSVAANAGLQRTGTMIIAGQTFTVTQEIGCPAITVNPISPALPAGTAGTAYSQTFTQTGGNGAATFTLSAGALPMGMTLNTTGVLSGTPTTAGSFSFTIRALDANNCTGERAYTIIVNPACSFAINPASQNFASLGGPGSVINVTAGSGCTWTATSNAVWILIIGSASGSGNGTVNFTVAVNGGPQRTGTMTIAGQTFTVTQATADCLSVSIPDTLSGAQGSTLTVPITISDPFGRGIVAYDFTLMFDPAVLSLQTPAFDTAGTLSSMMTITPNASVPGRITISAFGTDPNGLISAGTLLNLKFNVVGATASCSDLTWVGFTFNEGTPCATTSNGRACVDGTISGAISYCLAPAKKVPGVLVAASSLQSNTTNSSGNYILTGLSGGALTVTPAKTGDINGISSFDASLAAQRAAGLISFTSCQESAADASNNSAVSSFDASLIAQYAAGISNAGSVAGTWKFAPPNRVYSSVTGDLTGQNYDAVLVGDVSGNWAAPGNGPSPAAVQVPVSLPNTSGLTGASVTIPIMVGSLTGQGFMSYDFDLTFDQNVLQLQNPPVDAAGTLSSGMTITPNPMPGRLRISAFGVSPLAGIGTLLTLKFNVVGAVGTTTALNWQSFTFNEKIQTGLTNGSLAVCATINFTPANLSTGMQGIPYNQTLTASGGTAPYNFSLSAGMLPGNLNLSSAGALSGTPATADAFSFTVRATDANGCFGERQYLLTINPGGAGNSLQFYPLTSPVRLLDTRSGATGCVTDVGTLAANSTRTQAARTACSTIPTNATAIIGNITVVPSEPGFLTLYPSDATQPTVANSNFTAGEVTNNFFTVGLGADGAFKIFSSAPTHVIIDLTGYYAPPGAGGLYYHPLPSPVRLVQTFPGQSGCFANPTVTQLQGTNDPNANPALDLAVDGRGAGLPSPCNGIPSDAVVLVGNATTVFPQAPFGFGYLTIYPSDASRPTVASSNYGNNDIVNGPFAVKLGADGKFKVYTFSTTHLVIDISGYYSTSANDTNGVGLLFNPLPKPMRLLETRDIPNLTLTGCYQPKAPIPGGTGGIRTQQVWGACADQPITIPNTARAIVGNVTAINPVNAGFGTFFPGNVGTAPTVATTNYPFPVVFGYNRHYYVGLSPSDGTFQILTQFTSDYIVDVSGYFAP